MEFLLQHSPTVRVLWTLTFAYGCFPAPGIVLMRASKSRARRASLVSFGARHENHCGKTP